MLHIVMGMPGSGKSSATKYLGQKLNAIVVNTDVMHSLMFPSGDKTASGDFTPQQLEEIYRALRPIAHFIVKSAPESHFIIEGSFRYAKQRDFIIDEMKNMGHPYSIVYIELSNEKEAKTRISNRFNEGKSDATYQSYVDVKRIFEKPETAYKIDNSSDLENLYFQLDKYLEIINNDRKS